MVTLSFSISGVSFFNRSVLSFIAHNLTSIAVFAQVTNSGKSPNFKRRIDSKRMLPRRWRKWLRKPYVDSKGVLPSYAPENESNYTAGSIGTEALALPPRGQRA